MTSALIFKNRRLYYLDQRKLPLKEEWKECKNLRDAFLAIRELRIRGAPLIGVFAGYSVYIAIKNHREQDKGKFFKFLERVISFLKTSRPTAINLFWALDRIKKVVYQNKSKSIKELKELILKEAEMIHYEDRLLCRKMAENGIRLIKKGDRILTHCNTGFLATSGEGTALGVIYKGAHRYKNIKVYVDETRPLLQGARLTSWELIKRKIDVTLISDNMAAYLMQKGEIDKVFVGADRITRCGDVANKIGTYNLAVLAKYHHLPFYVVAPSTSFDLTIEKGEEIPIEQRSPDEVRKVLGKIYISPKRVKVYNPAFDVTPCQLISAIVTDRGIIKPPFKESILKIFYG